MTGIPKAGRPQEPTGTSRGGIACSTATMQDPWQWFPASDSVTGSPAPSTIDVGERPSPIFTPAGRHRGTFATLLRLDNGRHADACPPSRASDRQCQLAECHCHTPGDQLVDREFVVAAS